MVSIGIGADCGVFRLRSSGGSCSVRSIKQSVFIRGNVQILSSSSFSSWLCVKCLSGFSQVFCLGVQNSEVSSLLGLFTYTARLLLF